MTNDHWLALLVILAVLGWISTAILIRAARKLPEPALLERAAVAITLSVGATLVAIIAGAALTRASLPPGFAFAFLVGACVLLNLPQLVWVTVLATGRFK